LYPVLAGFSIPLRFALGRLLALLLKAHHKLALVLSRKRGKEVPSEPLFPVFDQKRWSKSTQSV
jgi:hypothetical protein